MHVEAALQAYMLMFLLLLYAVHFYSFFYSSVCIVVTPTPAFALILSYHAFSCAVYLFFSFSSYVFVGSV